MTLLTAHQVAGYWTGAGGPRNRAVEWVAIAMGESGLDDSVVSSAGAIGLWQIMPFHAAEFGITVDSLYDPRTNALVAVSLSGYGTNCAAWDSCYLDIQRSGRYAFLGWPEQGSADYNNLATAANELGQNPGYTQSITVPPVPDSSVDRAVARIQFSLSRYMPHTAVVLLKERQAMGKMFTKGWHP